MSGRGEYYEGVDGTPERLEVLERAIKIHGDYKLRIIEGKPLPDDCIYSDGDLLAILFGG